MYQSGIPKKLLLTLRAAFLVSAAAFAAIAIAAPYLVEGQAVHKHLREKLEAWSGGEVESLGRIELASFLALTVEAKDIKLKGVTKLGPVNQIEAKSLKAIIAFSDLLTGSLGFEKLVLVRPDIEVRHGAFANWRRDAEAGDISKSLSALDVDSFGTLIVRSGRVRMAGQGREGGAEDFALRSLKVSGSSSGKRVIKARGEFRGQRVQVYARQKPGPEGVRNIQLKLNGPHFEASFDGSSMQNRLGVTGEASLAVQNLQAFASWAPELAGLARNQGPLTISSGLSYDGKRLGLDNLSLRYGPSSGAGFLSLTFANGRPFLEGTTSWSELFIEDVLSGFPLSGSDVTAASGQSSAFSLLSAIDADLRVSADRVAGFGQVMSRSAAAVALRQGQLSMDMAELHALGGVARGRLEADLRQGVPVSLGASIEGADLTRLTALLGVSHLGSGEADVTVDLQFGETPAMWKHGAKGQVRVNIPDRAVLSEQISREIAASLIADERAAVSALPQPILLDDTKFLANVDAGSAALQLQGSLPGAGMARATGTLDLLSNGLRGRIDFAPDPEAGKATGSIFPAPRARKPVIFSGSLAQVQFTSEKAIPLSN